MIDLRTKDIAALWTVFRRFPSVQEVRVFGSRALGSARRASDLDVAITAPTATPADWADLCDAIENAPLIYELDIVRTDRTLNPHLKARIHHEGILLYPEKSAP